MNWTAFFWELRCTIWDICSSPHLPNILLAQAILDAIGASASAGSEAVAAAERHIDLLTARAGSRDPSTVPTICRISAALQYTPGTKKYKFSAS